MSKLTGKVAIVTGSSKGIGAGIALQLAQDGASVVINYSSSKKEADEIVRKITTNGGKAIAVQANIAQKQDIDHLFAETIKAFKKVDILVNNAGIYSFTPIEEITEEGFHKMFNINILGLLLASQAAAKHFGKDGGSIINIGSVAGFSPSANFSVYSATKAAVYAITQSLAKELGPRKIRVNAVNPGLVETEGTQAGNITDSEFRRNIEQQTPLGRIGQPKDIAPAVSFLASDDAAWITGEALYISGGLR